MCSFSFYHSMTLFNFLIESPRTQKSTIINLNKSRWHPTLIEKISKKTNKAKKIGGKIQGRLLGLDLN